jgi:hypothetical protein
VKLYQQLTVVSGKSSGRNLNRAASPQEGQISNEYVLQDIKGLVGKQQPLNRGAIGKH